MMPSTKPSLAADLKNIHKVISQALIIDTQKGIEYLQSGFSSTNEALGYTKFNNCIVSILCSHHQAEDLVAFPAFRKVLPRVPYDQLAAEHHDIESLLALIPELTRDISGDTPEYGLRVLVIILRKISKIWEGHTKLEEQCFSEASIPAALEMKIQQDICGAVIKMRHEQIRPPYWVVPFLLFKVDYQDRTSMVSAFPSMIDDFAPTGWKNEWVPSIPFYQD